MIMALWLYPLTYFTRTNLIGCPEYLTIAHIIQLPGSDQLFDHLLDLAGDKTLQHLPIVIIPKEITGQDDK